MLESSFGEKVMSNALFYQRFVDRFPSVKSAKPKDICFFVSRRGKYGYLSNFLIEKGGHIGEDGILFCSSEHELHYLKAKTFSDTKVMKMILQTKDPAQAKKLGREVSGFDEEIWRERRYKCVLQSVWNKFGQCSELSKILLSTGDNYLVESGMTLFLAWVCGNLRRVIQGDAKLMIRLLTSTPTSGRA